jgi:putative aldouronate transport system permease protein
MGGGTGMISILIVKSAYQGIPDGILEASVIDGAHDFQTLWHIAIPCIKPTIAVLAFQQGVASWNSWIWANILLRREEQIPLQLYLRNFIRIQADLMEAADLFLDPAFSTTTLIYALIFAAMLPVIIVFPYMQKYFKRGIFEGGIKA